MKNVQGLLSLALVLVSLSACGRSTTTLYWNGTAWVSSLSSTGSSAATATPTKIYALTGDGVLDTFSITVATGNLVLTTTPATQTFVTAVSITAGVWTYKINGSTHSVDLYATSDLNTLVSSFTVPTGITSIAIAE